MGREDREPHRMVEWNLEEIPYSKQEWQERGALIRDRVKEFSTLEPCLLLKEDLERVASETVKIFGGVAGVRDEVALEAALNATKALASDLRYDTHEQAAVNTHTVAAAYCEYLATLKPFNDNNALVGYYGALVFLEGNYRTTRELDPWNALDLTWHEPHEKAREVKERVERLTKAGREELAELLSKKTAMDEVWAVHHRETAQQKAQNHEILSRGSLIHQARLGLTMRSQTVTTSAEREQTTKAEQKAEKKTEAKTPDRAQARSSKQASQPAQAAQQSHNHAQGMSQGRK